jgi:nucleoside-diphosphate-sugar epimerase
VRTVDLDIGRLAHATGHPNLDLLVADLTDPSTREKIVRGIDTVYHLASAHLDVRQSESHFLAVNVGATLGLVRAAHAAGVQRFVHCSSVGVFGDLANPPADEDTPCFPTNIYERSKLEGERAVLQYARETGFDLVVARPAWVFGPRCPRTRKLLHAVGKGYFVIFGQGRNLRHPVYVSDTIRGLELCAQVPGIAGRIYILAGEEPVTVTQLVSVVSDVLNVRKPAIHMPLALGRLVAWLMEVSCKPVRRQPPFSHRSMDFFSRTTPIPSKKPEAILVLLPRWTSGPASFGR